MNQNILTAQLMEMTRSKKKNKQCYGLSTHFSKISLIGFNPSKMKRIKYLLIKRNFMEYSDIFQRGKHDKLALFMKHSRYVNFIFKISKGTNQICI